MSASQHPRMTADAYLAWAMTRPKGERYELVAGELVAMSPERASHNEAKGNVYLALRQAIRERGLPCWAYVDRMAVRVDEDTVYEPDVLVRCGERLDPDAIAVTDPLILVEVISPSSNKVDTHQKLGDYLRMPSVRHHLIVNAKRRTVVHHERREDGEVGTRIAAAGTLRLDPPGLNVDTADLFPDAG